MDGLIEHRNGLRLSSFGVVRASNRNRFRKTRFDRPVTFLTKGVDKIGVGQFRGNGLHRKRKGWIKISTSLSLAEARCRDWLERQADKLRLDRVLQKGVHLESLVVGKVLEGGLSPGGVGARDVVLHRGVMRGFQVHAAVGEQVGTVGTGGCKNRNKN